MTMNKNITMFSSCRTIRRCMAACVVAAITGCLCRQGTPTLASQSPPHPCITITLYYYINNFTDNDYFWAMVIVRVPQKSSFSTIIIHGSISRQQLSQQQYWQLLMQLALVQVLQYHTVYLYQVVQLYCTWYQVLASQYYSYISDQYRTSSMRIEGEIKQATPLSIFQKI